MKRKNIYDDYVKERLIEWAKWFLKGGYGAPGQQEHIIAKLMEQGLITHGSSSSRYLPTHTEAEEIEALIQKLSMQHRLLADALRIRYLNSFSHQQRAKHLGYKESQYCFYLKAAHDWMKEELYLNQFKKFYKK
jgi:hypothetical protein